MSIGRLERADPVAHRVAAMANGQGADLGQDSRGGFESLLQMAKGANGVVAAANGRAAASSSRTNVERSPEGEVEAPVGTATQAPQAPTSNADTPDADQEPVATAPMPESAEAADAEPTGEPVVLATALTAQAELMLSAVLAPMPAPVPLPAVTVEAPAEEPEIESLDSAAESASQITTIAENPVESIPVAGSQAAAAESASGPQGAADRAAAAERNARAAEAAARLQVSERRAQEDGTAARQAETDARDAVQTDAEREAYAALTRRNAAQQEMRVARAQAEVAVNAHDPTRRLHTESAPAPLPRGEGTTLNEAQTNNGQVTADAVRETARALAQGTPSDATAMERRAELESVTAQAREVLLAGVRERRGETELQLDPPEWGRIAVRIAVDHHKGVNVAILAERPMVREALEQSLVQLRAALEQQGLQLGQMNVGLGSEHSWAQHLAEWRQLTSAAAGPRMRAPLHDSLGTASLRRTEGFNAIA